MMTRRWFGPYLAEEKPKATVLFADNLDSYFSVSSFPTTLILGRDGKIAFRSDGFDPDTVDKTLRDAIERALHGQAETSQSEGEPRHGVESGPVEVRIY